MTDPRIDEARRALTRDLTVRQSPGDSLHQMSARAVQHLRDSLEEMIAAAAAHTPPEGGREARAAVRRAVGSVLFNVSNFPERAQSHLWGANMGPLNEKITEAVVAVLPEAQTPTDTALTAGQRAAGQIREDGSRIKAGDIYTVPGSVTTPIRGIGARTPTDDEREALDYAIRCAIPTDLDYRPLWKLIRAIQDSVLAAGFRRSEVPEPSAHDDGCADFYPEYGSPEAGVCKVCGDHVQGEPSDARGIIARALMGEARMGSFSAWDLADDIVAALRAAGGAR